jgi:hypothetical protein
VVSYRYKIFFRYEIKPTESHIPPNKEKRCGQKTLAQRKNPGDIVKDVKKPVCITDHLRI